RPNAYPAPFNFVRKMACNFGWDWGPSLVTAGIWKPIALHEWSIARLSRVRPLITVEEGAGRVRVAADLEWSETPPQPLALIAEIDGARRSADVLPGAASAEVVIDVAEPALWWPHSHGDQPLYDLAVWLAPAGDSDAAGEEALDHWSRRVGFRTVELDSSDDATGSRFTIVVNGVPTFTRGANWIPDDCFPTRVTDERYRHRISQARAANIDLLRVWGGGIYESDAFYEACDELGVLVWQDFLFACAAYPEEEPLGEEVAAEAREAVARLMPHPSLALWNGNNENLWGYLDWGWRAELGDRTWGLRYYLDLLPRIVAEVDPTRPYWPGSPYSGTLDIHPNDERHGTMHLWDVWNERDYTAYREHLPRFAAEFGFQGPAAWATIRRAISDEPLEPDSPGMRHHQKAAGGNDKVLSWLDRHFGAPGSFDDWHFLAQVNQARAVALGVEHFRSHRPRCMGTVVWQLNDCWPVTSWSAIDSDGRRKPVWFALRRAYADRLITIQPRGAGLSVIAVNETDRHWRQDLAVTRQSFDGKVVAELRAELACAPRAAVTLPLPDRVAQPGDAARELLAATAGARRALWFFAEDIDLAYPAPAYQTTATRSPGGYSVTVAAQSLLRDLCLLADRAAPGAEVDDMLITLLPGESATFSVRADGLSSPAGLLSPPVLRCVNDVGAASPDSRYR
ncbi:MAG TPA: hypothetical protein VML96_10225, partial [Egibacteraceae bacterium]|nr:hypothetical protein [Egibacteraceae bacterium]